MRVLMISKTFVSSTSQRKLEELAKYPEVELTLVTPPYWRSDDGGKQILERLYTDGYRMIVTPMALNGHFHTYFYPRLGQIMREVRPEIIHIDEEAYNLATFQAMRLALRQNLYPSQRGDSGSPGKVPVLFVAWQNLHRDYPPPFRQIELYNYHHAAIAIAGSRDVAEVLKRKGFKGAIRIIPLSIDPQIYRRSESRPQRARDDPFTLGYVGRLKEEKGLALLVEALVNLPDYCRVVFIGHGPMRGELEEQAAHLGVAGRVTFKDAIAPQAVPKEMQQMDAFVLPSLTRPNWMEQFGRVLIEAMACETPVIGSSSGEIPNVIGSAGLIFQEGNFQELCARVRQLLEDPALYTRLATQGRQRVLENYTQQRIAQQTYEVYLEMMSRKMESSEDIIRVEP